MSYRYVELSGSRIAYRVHGSGPAIVLMKNNRRPLDYPIVEQLSQQFRVLQLHPIGFGASSRPEDFDLRRDADRFPDGRRHAANGTGPATAPATAGVLAEFDGLNHGACGLGDASADGRRVAQVVVDQLLRRGGGVGE